ncbi:MAG: hypothetical protein QHJ73_11045 [Armatimonadota bacterium]|nr:hypothetical protein [Armatimonadota bacterium]
MRRYIASGVAVLVLGVLGSLAAKPLPKKPVAPAPAPTPAAPVNDKVICLEAESGKITPPVTLYQSPDCSGGSAIEVKEGVNPKVKEGEATPILSGDCVIHFKVLRAGMYQFYARAWWLDGCGNSFYITFDDGPRMTISDGQYKSWHWVRGPKVRLEAGTHTLKFANSEDGARLDQVFLTCDVDPRTGESVPVPVGKWKVTPWALVK